MAQFVPTATNMVAIVRNTIQGYGMGPIRALAQEPVQNSKDAARGNASVEYKLHRRSGADGAVTYLLTVTDHNTSGLRGSIRSLADLPAQGQALNEGENWAAFEGMGYTKKSSEDALGSRGQGKSAFLYHSILPSAEFTKQERMMILYDTLLPDNEYRLGVRYANPSDFVLSPPHTGDEARRVVSSHYVMEDGTVFDLELDPLTEIGTRIIVPCLSEEATAAFRSGELYRWLQRCWWRAVQTGLSITLVDEHGVPQSVSVPSWWESEPWKSKSPNIAVHSNIDMGDGLKIKRIVLLYDPSLNEPDIEGYLPQFWGVQLLRGQQWIETLGQDLFDHIPQEKRPGFRGFVEFERRAEQSLRKAEHPQHDHFDRRAPIVKAVIAKIEDIVREFAENQGWGAQPSTHPAPQKELGAAMEFLHFLAPRARRRNQNGSNAAGGKQISMDLTDRWTCELHLDFPDVRSARVNWGGYIRNIEAVVKLEPLGNTKANVSLELTPVDDPTVRMTLAEHQVAIHDGEGVVSFGDYQVIAGVAGPGKMQCTHPGKWRLITLVHSSGVQVARASRTLYVHEDPPSPPDPKPYGLSISVENHTTQQRRINSGDRVGLQVNVSNRTTEGQTLHLTASLGELLLADRIPVQVPGVRMGDAPNRVAGIQEELVVNPATAVNPDTSSIELAPGKHALRADLYLGEELMAHASRTLDVEVDPARSQDWPPFGIEQISSGTPQPRWRFNKRAPDDWVLQFPEAYPLYRALSGSANGGLALLSGTPAFVVDICAEGIIEWALEPVDSNDMSRIDELLDGVPDGADYGRWDEFCDGMRQLATLRGRAEELDRYNLLARECAARTLSLFEERR